MFEKISERAREELKSFKTRRVASFQKSLSEMAELELKHSRAHAQMLKATIANLRADLWKPKKHFVCNGYDEKCWYICFEDARADEPSDKSL